MKGGVSVAMILMWMILQLQADLSRATSSGHINGTFTGCSGSDLDCLIADDWDADFPMNSHLGRMLYEFSKSATGKTGNRDRPAVDCKKNEGYRSCLPQRNPGAPPQPCGDYTRGC